MTRGFKKLFWGFIIVNLSILIGVIPILPAFVGWLVVWSALSDLEEHLPSKDLRFVSRTVLVLTVLSLADLTTVFSAILPAFSSLFQFFPVIMVLIELSVFHKLLEITARQFYRMNRTEKGDLIVSRDKWYLLMVGLAVVSLISAITLNNPQLLIMGTVSMLAARVYILFIMYSLNKEDLELKVA